MRYFHKTEGQIASIVVETFAKACKAERLARRTSDKEIYTTKGQRLGYEIGVRDVAEID